MMTLAEENFFSVLRPWGARDAYRAFFTALNRGPGTRMRLYLALFEKQICASSMLYLADTAAGLYFLSVLPRSRKKGTGLALVKDNLFERQAFGYRAAVLQSSPAGASVYRTAGFRDIGTVNIFQHRKSAVSRR